MEDNLEMMTMHLHGFNETKAILKKRIKLKSIWIPDTMKQSVKQPIEQTAKHQVS